MKKHVILFLAANPSVSNPLCLAEECAEIQRELKMSPHRDDFQFESRWAIGIDELMRHLNELAPTVIHFSGHAGSNRGLLLQDDQGHPQPVSGRAFAMMVDAAARNARVVVLNACSTTALADMLRAKVECVVGMDGAIGDAAARAFAVRFYGALGNRRSIGNAVNQGVAALAAKELPDEVLPRCVTRDGVDADQLVLLPVAKSIANHARNTDSLLVLDIGNINLPSSRTPCAELRFSLTNLTDDIVKITTLALELESVAEYTKLEITHVAVPIDEYFLHTYLRPSLATYDLLNKHHELRQRTEGFFLKIDADEGYQYTGCLRAIWHLLGASNHYTTYSHKFQLDFPIRSVEGMLRLAQSQSTALISGSKENKK